ncbi:MAG: Trk system potassium transporter TrkA [Pirellulaceae bacterium]
MRIVVLGAGTVGTWIADLLCQHRHSVTVVDRNPEHTQRINNELDVRAITGSAAESSVLFQADVIGADVCLAVTGVDEVNLIAASMAKAMGSRRAIARVFLPVFRDRSTFDYERHFRIDRLLSLEQMTAYDLARGILSPGSLTVEHLADGHLEIEEVTIADGSLPCLGKPLADISFPKGVRVGTIGRAGKTWIAGAADVLEPGDHVTLIGEHDSIEKVRSMFKRKVDSKMGIVIAGGGETGAHLARALDSKRFSVTLMESDRDRCEFLAQVLPHATVVRADATRRTVLEEERVGSADVFAACTGDDENNIMASVEAKEVGAKNILAVVGRPDYANVVGKLGIDLAVSPRDVMAKQILSFLHKGPVISRKMIGGGIGIFEIEVREGADATKYDLKSLPLPPACLIIAVIRQDYVRVPGADDHLKADDHVVVLADDSAADQMLALFH